MEIATKKFLKVPLVLLIFLGMVFGFSCVISHSETLAHSTSAEMGSVFGQESENCCGTNLSQHHKPLHGEDLTFLRITHRNFFDLLILSFVTISLVFGRRLLDDRLSTLKKLYIWNNPSIPLFNHLVLAFSRGILKPKKYNLSFSN